MSLLSRIGESWRDAARDIVLIVASIMIAFVVDAWWDGRLETSRATGHLAALGDEFSGIRINLLDEESALRRADSATRALLTLMAADPPVISADSLSRLFNSSYDVGISAPVGGALLALLGSGDIRLLRQDSLTYLLAAWPASMATMRVQSDILIANREQEIRSRLISLGVPEAAIAAHLAWLDLPRSRFRFDPQVILNDSGIESMLVARLIRLRVLEDEVASAIQRSNRILALLSER